MTISRSAVWSLHATPVATAGPGELTRRVARSAWDRAIRGPRYRAGLAHYQRGQGEASAWLEQRYGNVVAGGPFAGMIYPAPAAVDGALPSKLLGLYERELAEVVERVIAAGPRRVVDIGCSTGYYLVGLARRLPEAELWGYDVNPVAAREAEAAAAANDVAGRVHVEARACEPSELDRLAGPDSLVFVDIEGAEDELLDPGQVRALTSSTVVVELHDFIRPGISTRLAARFEPTHHVEFVHADPLRHVEHPATLALPKPLRRWVDEMRPEGMRWALLTPR